MLISNSKDNPGVVINLENVEVISKKEYKSQIGYKFNDTVWQIQFKFVSGNSVSWEYDTEEERDLQFDKIGNW